ncbi:MAG: hypothetical protein QM504_00680 [Pseudomonadota bacterium]
MKKFFIISILFLFSLNTYATTLLLDGGGRSFGATDRLNLSIGLQHNEANTTADSYLVLYTPSKSLIFFSTSASGELTYKVGTLDSAGWTPYQQGISLTNGLDTGLELILSIVSLSPKVAKGTYYWIYFLTDPGSTEITKITSYDFKVVPITLDPILGTYVGTWTSNAETSGVATYIVKHASKPGKVTISLDLEGISIGPADSEPMAFDATINDNGSVSFTGDIIGKNSVVLADSVKFFMNTSFAFQFEAKNLTQWDLDTFTSTGSLSNETITLNFITSGIGTGNSEIEGTVTGKKVD